MNSAIMPIVRTLTGTAYPIKNEPGNQGSRSARGVMVIVIGNGHGDTSSNPGRDWLHFT